MRRIVALLAIGCTLAVGMTGCGKTAAPLTHAQYAAQLEQIQAPLQQTTATLAQGDPTLVVTAFTQLQSDLRVAAAALDKLNPPLDAAAAHGQLQRGMTELADELTPIIAQATDGHLAAASAAFNSSRGVADQTAAGLKLQALGYR